VSVKALTDPALDRHGSVDRIGKVLREPVFFVVVLVFDNGMEVGAVEQTTLTELDS
jgi:hypothetical protein